MKSASLPAKSGMEKQDKNGDEMTAKTASLKTVSIKSGDMTFEAIVPRAMSAREYEERYRVEKKILQRHYCTLFAFWKSCRCKPCRKARACVGDAAACLKRNEGWVSREKQFAARQEVLDATPGNMGAPERLARQAMPGGLCG
jgi:hypothetical protein